MPTPPSQPRGHWTCQLRLQDEEANKGGNTQAVRNKSESARCQAKKAEFVIDDRMLVQEKLDPARGFICQ